MLKMQTQQQVEAARLKRSYCQAMVETAIQFSPLLTRQFFEELAPIIPHLGEAVIPSMSPHLEFRDLSLTVATMVSFYDFNFLKKLEPSSGGLISADGMVPISRPKNRVRVLRYIRAAYGGVKIDYLQGVEQQDTWIEADPLIDLATVYLVEKKYESAKNWYKRALKALLKQPNHDRCKIASLWNKLGLLNYLENDYENAESAYQESLNIQHQCLNVSNFDVAETLNNLEVLYCHQRQFPRAKLLLDKVLEIHHKFAIPTRTQIRCYTMATQQSLNNMRREMECASTHRETISKH